MPDCSFPGCPHPVVAKNYCVGHYKQHRRGEELRPLRARGLVRLGTLRVSAECAEQLEARGPNATRAAIDVLENWAKKS